jgi:UDP-glucose 6-dehydrogenase
MKIDIVGHGFVGRYLEQLFNPGHHIVVIDDKFNSAANAVTRQAEINRCNLVFVAVPTPSTMTGECDTSAVDEVVVWIQAPICLKSTVPPGTVSRLVESTGKQIAFSPEYIGETPFHRYINMGIPDLVAVGGTRQFCELVVNAFRSVLGPQSRYFVTDSTTAELTKYMEN